MRTGLPICLSIRSDATLTQGSFAGNGGAGIVSTGARMVQRRRTVASPTRSAVRHPRGTPMEFWSQLEAVRERHDVLTHPFYQRWSAGELTRAELAVYAGQYRHAVVALARAS